MQSPHRRITIFSYRAIGVASDESETIESTCLRITPELLVPLDIGVFKRRFYFQRFCGTKERTDREQGQSGNRAGFCRGQPPI